LGLSDNPYSDAVEDGAREKGQKKRTEDATAETKEGVEYGQLPSKRPTLKQRDLSGVGETRRQKGTSEIYIVSGDKRVRQRQGRVTYQALAQSRYLETGGGEEGEKSGV